MMKSKWLKWLLWVVGILALIIAGAFLAFTVFMNKSKPIINGEKIVTVLEDDVEVTRDKDGVPHIVAQSDADLYRAQGYVQAQDRLFQIDLARRQASGTLSEVIGENSTGF